jgi:hypothetical protein
MLQQLHTSQRARAHFHCMDRDLRAILYADDCPESNPRVEHSKLGLHKLTTMADLSMVYQIYPVYQDGP